MSQGHTGRLGSLGFLLLLGKFRLLFFGGFLGLVSSHRNRFPIPPTALSTADRYGTRIISCISHGEQHKNKTKKTSQYTTSFTNTKTSHVPKKITTHHRPEKKSQKREQEERGGERGRETKDCIHTHEKEKKKKNSTPLLSLLRNAETDLPVDTPPQPSQTPEVLQIQETPRAENADSKHLGSEGKGGQGWGVKERSKTHHRECESHTQAFATV
jgi:hypothetical protein